MDLSNVAVVILNYNTKKYLASFLPLVIKYSGNARVVVVDNHSKDGSAALVASEFPQVTLIQLHENLGFCGGYNTALQQVKADYFVLLNSDVEVTENWLIPMISLMKSSPKVAACQPKIKCYHQKDQYEYAGGAGGFIDYLGYPFSRGRLFETLETDQGQYDDEVEVFWATGACMCINSTLYQQFGGLDERFFAHMEEIDLCWRLKNAGYKILFTPHSQVYHIGGGTLNKTSPRKTFYNFRNGLFLLLKNLPANQLHRIFWRLVLDGIAGARFLLLGEFKNTWAIFRAHISFYLHFREMYTERKNSPKQSSFPEIYKRSLVKDYFLLGKRTFKELAFNSSLKKSDYKEF
ncbi:glycosyltransferase family 2 protein [Rapidithrix thailandica]|uniref:Glycosyltransferase family 2 protein n=1 Tax=Rapidithrix thailandica TaxID=413964 RepID=A0AAW9SES0_9BACT